MVACDCRADAIRAERLDLLLQRGNLGPLRHLTFDESASAGPSADPTLQRRFEEAMELARRYADRPNGWLVLAGASGSGKTHLAAAIANHSMDAGTPTLFMVVSDLLDHLRTIVGPETADDYHQTFEDLKNVPLLVLDDLGAQSSTPWADEKLYQILNHRFNSRLPTVITTSIPLAQLDDRLRTRFNDTTLVAVCDLAQAPEGDSGDLNVQALKLLSAMTFDSFESRRSGLTEKQHQSLVHAYKAAKSYAGDPDGWLVLMGDVGSGKTHLAAAIANHRTSRGLPALFVVVSDLLDHLRSTYAPDSPITYDAMVQRIRTAPFLVLDDLGTQTATPWAREKLFQIVNHRYNDRLPTVFTSSQEMDDLTQADPRLASRLIDTSLTAAFILDVPDYRSGELTRPKRAPETPTRRRGRAR